MAKKSYKIKKTQNLDEILIGLTERFLSMRVEAPTREGVEWVTGLTDIEDDPEVHYLRCSDHETAVQIVNELVLNRNCVRGQDFGTNPTIVYLSCESM